MYWQPNFTWTSFSVIYFPDKTFFKTVLPYWVDHFAYLLFARGLYSSGTFRGSIF